MRRFLCWLSFQHSPRSRIGHRTGAALLFTYWACQRCGHEWVKMEFLK